jgi:hypothetical protein
MDRAVGRHRAMLAVVAVVALAVVAGAVVLWLDGRPTRSTVAGQPDRHCCIGGDRLQTARLPP